jgi:UDP-glucuronate decarboxylase
LGTAPRDSVPPGEFEIVDVRHLVDKGGNSAPVVRELIDGGEAAYRSGKTVVVACDLGISRSNAIAAGLLARVEGLTFDAAMRDVIAKTKEPEIKLDLAEAVRTVLGEGGFAASRDNVLVTGASGFVGTGLVRRLSGACKVYGPPRSELDLDMGAVTVADYCRRHEIGQIVHLAYPREYTNASAAASSMLLLRTVLDACRLLRIRLVFISGSVIYSGYQTSALLADETMPMRAKGIYPETKATEEFLVDLYAQRGDVQRSICRLAPVYGPGGTRPRLIHTFQQRLIAGQPIQTHRYSNGRPAMDLLHVSDAVDGIAAVVSSATDDVYHFGTGTLTQTVKIAEMIAQITGRRLLHEEIDIDDFTSNVAFPSLKARAHLGWAPRMSVQDGLVGMLDVKGE